MSNGLAKLVGSQSVGDSAIKSLSYMQKAVLGTVLLIFLLIMMGYSIIKVFFANLKKRRYPFSNDCSRIALYVFNCAWLYRWFYSMVQADHWYMSYCILQAVILIAGLGVMKENCLLGIGLILAASEIPRIAGQFGLDTSMKANIMSTVYELSQL